MKLIALYLPQFHEIEENNRAWGKGFTEWDNVKKAKPLFERHDQPRKPLHENYYNLLDIDTMRWQVDLAKKYGISGFCFYHYWFRDGKRVLEKPAELLLFQQDIEMPFCFSWANEPWTKTWHGAGGEKEVLLEQRYGEEDQWKEHIEYLFSFFKDSRYIRIDGKPVFLIYQINKIGCFDRMIDFWNDYLVRHGEETLYLIDMLTGDGKVTKNKRISASMDFEPGKSWRRSIMERENEDQINKADYNEVYYRMIHSPHLKNQYRCAFVDYDDTPRRGKKGMVLTGGTPETFGKYLQETIRMSQLEQKEYIFINAWNEWGEGNYLEPDEKNGYAYLEAVSNALQSKYNIKEALFSNDYDIVAKEDEQEIKKVDKFRSYYELYNQWIKKITAGYKLENYFLEHNYKTIAIYGMGEIANRLIETLKNTAVDISYGIDRNTIQAFAEITILGLDEKDKFNGIDAVIVTPIFAFDKIKAVLQNKVECPIVSIEDVIYGL